MHLFFAAALLLAGSGPPGVELHGTVRAAGDPPHGLADATVVLIRDDRVVATARTDAAGRYRFAGVPDGLYRLVALSGAGGDGGRVVAEVAVAGAPVERELRLDAAPTETIDIYEHRPVETPARPLDLSRRKTLPYSDEAIDSNVWGAATFLVYVDELGRAVAARAVRRAGHGLDEIGLRELFAGRFEPARDPAGRRMRSTLFVRIEWPPWWWMRDPNMPPEMAIVYQPPTCAGTGPLNLDYSMPVYRDCDAARPVRPAELRAAPLHLGTAPAAALGPTTLVAALGDAQRRAFCAWADDVARPYGAAPRFPDVLAGAARCGRTVEELAICVMSRAADPEGCGRCPDGR